MTLASLLALAGDHAWQSTLFAGLVALLTLVFRRNRADVRFALWLAASLKFLLPFAALVALGSSLGWTKAPLPQPELRLAVDAAAQPFSVRPSGAAAPEVSASDAINPWIAPAWRGSVLATLATVWMLGTLLLALRWSVQWRRLRALVARGTPMRGRELEILRTLHPSLPMLRVDSAIEPGVFGVLRPVLLWPATIGDRLDDEQIAAIVAHELAHVRRADNGTAILHMAVQALFWWHPLTWWIGARLVAERERACDEAVLRGGSEPRRYAESILRTCEFYVESPLSCVTGVTGADLKKRIETIMRDTPSETLGRARVLLLSAAAVGAIALPVVIGVMRAPRLLAQSSAAAETGARFEAVSIKRNTTQAPGGIARVQGAHYTAVNITLRQVITNAYGILQSQLAAGPRLATDDFMTSSEHFDIEATLPAGAGPAEFPAMLRAMLADRFKLVAHTETREMPVYALVKARADGRLGPGLKVSADEVCRDDGGNVGPGAPGRRAPAVPPPPPGAGAGGPGGAGSPGGPALAGRPQLGAPGCGQLMFGPGQFSAKGVTLSMLVNSLANRAPITGVDRVVLDRTDLSGVYDFELRWRMPPLPGRDAPPADPDRPDLFTALQEQLGLKLESQRAPIEVLIVDSVQMPTDN